MITRHRGRILETTLLLVLLSRLFLVLSTRGCTQLVLHQFDLFVPTPKYRLQMGSLPNGQGIFWFLGWLQCCQGCLCIIIPRRLHHESSIAILQQRPAREMHSPSLTDPVQSSLGKTSAVRNLLVC
ncbi:hypothetical protein EV426DRAFT_289942 [Tirmania nivea]|nr:hypothetical protein EV426DRAFT_289942 [Tirmania nivea]